MARVLVTGGAGFIGSHLVDMLRQGGHAVVVVDNLSTGKRSNLPAQTTLFRCDIRSKRLQEVFRHYRPQVIFHLAAQKSIKTSVENPALDADINISGTLNTLRLAQQHRVRTFIFSSTAGVYAATNTPPLSETAKLEPPSPYGIAKLAVEQYLSFYQQHYGLRTVSLRYANVYGPRQDPAGEAGVVAVFAQQLVRGTPLTINGHGEQTRDYVYVSDVVVANLLALKNPRVKGEINIGTGYQTNVNRLATVMMRVAQTKTRVTHRPKLAGEVMKIALASSLAKRKMRWTATTKLADGLQLTWAWAKEALA